MEQSKLINSRFTNKIIAILLVFCLITTNYALVGVSIAKAATEELEEKITKGSNIEFSAYFKGTTNANTKTPVLNTQGTEQLYLTLNVKDKVSLVEGKIKIEDPNFIIKQDELKENDYVKNVNIETNEIELNKIYSNTSVVIELPVQFKQQDKITSDYFEREIKINLNGKYESNKQKRLKGLVTVKPQWRAEASVNLSQSVEKLFNLGENGTILQQKITTEVVNNVLPRKDEKVEVMIPTIAEQKPSEVVVLVNGERQDSSHVVYDSEQGKLTITKSGSQDEQGNITWGEDKVYYTLAYRFDSKIDLAQVPVSLKTVATTSLYTIEETIQKEINDNVDIAPAGNIATVSTSLSGEIYKGYLYHNETKLTPFREQNDVEISYVEEGLEKLELQSNTSAFLNTAEVKVADCSTIIYQETQFQKQELFDILGEDGKVTIKRPNGEVIREVTNATETDDSGIIKVTYEMPESAIIIETTKPQKEGKFTVLNNKAIKGDTNQNINVLKSAKYIATNSEVTTNLSKETSKATLELKEPVSEAKIAIDKTELTTLNTNNVKIIATLVSNNEQYELFSNPKLQIKLPEQAQSVKVNSINKLYADELQFGATNQIGNTINIELVGEQAGHLSDVCEGAQVVIDCDITFDKITPSASSKIELSYTNKNNGNVVQTVSQDIKISSKSGALLYSKLDSINSDNASIETYSSDAVEGKINAKAPAKQTNATTEIVNNYDAPMTNVETIIDLTNNEVSEKDKAKNLILLSNVSAQKDNVQVLYLTQNNIENNEWQEQVENLQEVRKIKLVAQQLNPGEVMPVAYSMVIPENMVSKEITSQITTLNYKVEEQGYETKSTLNLKADLDITAGMKQGEIINQNLDGLQVSAQASSVGRDVQNGAPVVEGQVIRYNVTVKNNTGKNLTNFTINAKQTNEEGTSNVTFYNTVEKNTIQEQNGEEQISKYYEEDNTLQSKDFQRGILAIGETATFQYEFCINETTKEGETTKGLLNITASEIEEKQLDLLQNPIQQAELKVTTKYGLNEEVSFEAVASTIMTYTVTNLTDEKLEKVDFSIIAPEGTKINYEQLDKSLPYKIIEQNDNVAKLEITEIQPHSFFAMSVEIYVEEIDYDKEEQSYGFIAGAAINNNVYYSNEIQKTAQQKQLPIEITQVSNFEGEYVKAGDEIIFTTTVKNLSKKEKEYKFLDVLDEVLELQEGYILSGEEKIADLEKWESENVYEGIYKLKAQETIQIIEKVKVKENEKLVEGFYHFVSVSDIYKTQGEEQKLTFKFKIEQYKDPNESAGDKLPADPNGEWQPSERVPVGTQPTSLPSTSDPNQNQTGGEGNGNTSGGNTQWETGTGSISGQAWLDSNKDGIKNEAGISGLQTLLINASTGKIVTQEITNNFGNYSFQDLASGDYIVGVRFDTAKYSTTEYRAPGSDESNNNDFVTRNINIEGQDENLAVTDEVTINENSASNIDIGLTENQIFDLSIKKTVKKVTTYTAEGKKEKDFKNKDLAKIEIHRKAIAGAKILVEYTIKVTNEGDTEGSVSNIVDYLPSGFELEKELSSGWTQTAGKLNNQTLSGQVIHPKESKEINLTLSKVMTESTTGTFTNTAEIAEANNELSFKDRDSTPGNNKQGEDDISSAELIVSIGTGITTKIAIVISIILALAIIGFGIYKAQKNAKKEEV